MKLRVALLVALLVALVPSPAGAAEPHPPVGVVFDIREFKDGPDGGGLDDRFDGGATWDRGCEFDTRAEGWAQFLVVPQPDPCKPTTDGAPRPGIVPMSRTFRAAAGESYLSWAYAKVAGTKGQFVARVRLIARNGSGVLRACGGDGASIGRETADFMRLGTGVCTMPQGTSMVTVEFAAEARAAGASGRAVLNRLQLLRCASASPSCPTSVPTTTTTAAPPPPPPDSGDAGLPPSDAPVYDDAPAYGDAPVYDDPAAGDSPVYDDPTAGDPEADGEAAPETTVLPSGEVVTLRPIAGDQPQGGDGTPWVLVLGILTVAVALGTAAGWWAWGRDPR